MRGAPKYLLVLHSADINKLNSIRSLAFFDYCYRNSKNRRINAHVVCGTRKNRSIYKEFSQLVRIRSAVIVFSPFYPSGRWSANRSCTQSFIDTMTRGGGFAPLMGRGSCAPSFAECDEVALVPPTQGVPLHLTHAVSH